MGFTPGGAARVTIGIVALGIRPRLAEALQAFRAHASDVGFDIVCVINGVEHGHPGLTDLPSDVTVVTRRANLGYTGGLHLARAHASGEFLVWGQDDMLPLDGWLDALVTAADASARVAVVGALQVDPSGHAHPLNCGWTRPGTTMLWPTTPFTADPGTSPAADAGWVSGAGSLVRLKAWDEVGGTDLRLWPLNFVDLNFSVHVRAHGYSVVHAPGARIAHSKSGSSPRVLVEYTADRNTALLDAAGWPEVVGLLGDWGALAVPHPCTPWSGKQIEAIELEQLIEASLAYLPLMAELEDKVHEARVLRAELADIRKRIDHVTGSASWRVTRPLRAVMASVRRHFGRA